MRVRVQDAGLSPARELEDVSSLVLYDDFDQPILVVQRLERGSVIVSRCTDPDFKRLVSALGVGLNASCKMISMR
jgi:hypothetical protein